MKKMLKGGEAAGYAVLEVWTFADATLCQLPPCGALCCVATGCPGEKEAERHKRRKSKEARLDCDEEDGLSHDDGACQPTCLT